MRHARRWLAPAFLLGGSQLLLGCSSEPQFDLEATKFEATSLAPAVASGAESPPEAVPLPPPQTSLLAPVGGAREGSAIVLAALGGKRILFIADADDASVRAVDPETRGELSTKKIGGAPSQLLVGRDGRLYAAVRDRHSVAVLEATGESDASLREVGRLETAAEPFGLATSPDGSVLLVTSGWGHELAGFSTKTREQLFAVDLPREPRSVVVADDGSRAFVSHAVGSTISVVSLGPEGPSASGISLKGADVSVTLSCSRGDSYLKDRRYAVQGYALARLSEQIAAPIVSVHPEPDAPSGYGSADSPFSPQELAVVAVDMATGRATLRGREAVGPADGSRSKESHLASSKDPSPCLLPRAIGALPGRSSFLVACMGTDVVIEIDAKAAPLSRSELNRWRVAPGPLGIAVDDVSGLAYVWSQFGREISVIAPSSAKGKAGASKALLPASTMSVSPRSILSDELALGRRLFHAAGDARISSDGRACASCHPDGRDDGLVWKTPLGRLQTPQLAGRLEGTAPYGWSGESKTVKDHLTSTFKRLGGKGLKGAELDALVAYAMALEAPKRKVPSNAQAVERGREVFASAETMCSICHAENKGFTDGSPHEVGSGATLDTPSLRFLGGTAPYFHDGRYATLRDALLGSEGKMGQVRHLSPEDLSALEAYLMSL